MDVGEGDVVLVGVVEEDVVVVKVGVVELEVIATDVTKAELAVDFAKRGSRVVLVALSVVLAVKSNGWRCQSSGFRCIFGRAAMSLVVSLPFAARRCSLRRYN